MGQYDEPQAGPQDYDATSRAHVLTSGIVFSPSAELTHALPPVHDGLAKLGPSNVPASSLARMDFAMKAEVAVNEQIKYVVHVERSHWDEECDGVAASWSVNLDAYFNAAWS
jgi:hypothetical protein